MTKIEAQQLLSDAGYIQYRKGRYCKSGMYTLGHGEYERPDYQVRKTKGKTHYEIYCRTYFYSGSFGNNRGNYVLNNNDIAYFQMLIADKREGNE